MKWIWIAILPIILWSCEQESSTFAMIETDAGNMKIKLYNSTPQHRENFIELANKGFYDGLLFHRVMDGFMIQGGDPDSKDAKPGQQLGRGGPGYTIPAEIGAPHFKGALSAARQPDHVNPDRESSGSQFFIVHGSVQTDQQLDNMARSRNLTYNDAQRKLYKELGGYPFLDGEYTVFGEVVEGLEIIDNIAKVATDANRRPLEDIRIIKIEIL
ncbi:MAG: peptidylprolyl isomerase [Bacteroidota bacterium]